MSRNIAEITRTLLMITVMVASALMPMAPAAEELRDSPDRMNAISLDTTALSISEGHTGSYEIVLDMAPDGVLIITPISNNADITVDPAYLKFTKINFDEPQMVKVTTQEDDDGADTMAAISHTLAGTDTVYASASIADVYVTGVDLDTDTDGDGSHDGLDDDDDGDGVNDDAEEDGCDLLADCDGDGVNDDTDEFPTDGTEDTDTDGDGTGDNADDFPDDDTEDTDSDGDGTGDNADEFPDDDTEDTDSDGDGVGDNADDFPSDDTEDTDSDGDGVGDNADDFPDDANETADSDGDGVGDNDDAFPSDATEDTDSDGDGVGDNSDLYPDDANESADNDGDGTGDNADLDDDNDGVNDTDEGSNSTLDCSVSADCDGDGYGDADDAFDLDPEAWDDLDGDGLADSFPNLLVVTEIGCMVSVTSSDDDSDGDTEEDAECTFTLPAGGSMTLYVQTGSWSGETGVKLTHPDGTQTVWSHGTWGASNYGLYNFGTFTDAGDYVVQMYDSYGDGCNPSTYGDHSSGTSSSCYVYANAGTTMAMPSTSGYGTTADDDDDGDGYSDTDEDTCGTDSLNGSDAPTDTDNDGDCDAGVDDDDDDDGVDDADEEAGCELVADCDGDGVGDATDSHDNDATETSDMDGDGIGDNSDTDMDGDGYLDDGYDAFPEDGTEWADNDGDGVGDNADPNDDTCDTVADTDTDSDGIDDTAECGTFGGLGPLGYDTGDSYNDSDEDFPNDPNQQFDVDGDGWGNNADADDDDDGIDDVFDDDDDGDGYSDEDEDTNCVGDGGNSLTDTVTPDDMDADGTCDYLDTDRDGDGTNNSADAFEDDACADTDTDGDGNPDSIVAGCTTTLTEDDDDDYDTSAVPFTGIICSVGASDYSSEYTCTFTLEGGQELTVNMTTTSYAYEVGLTILEPGETTATDLRPVSTTLYERFECDDGSDQIYLFWVNDYWDDCADGSDEGVTDWSTDDSENTGHPNYVSWTTTTQVSFSNYADYSWTFTTAGTYTITLSDSFGDGGADLEAEIIQLGAAPVWPDADEVVCGTDPLDSTDEPTDTDSDGQCDDIQDDDNDGDGWTNSDEADCGESNSNTSASDFPTDTDTDGVCDGLDDDDDGDTVLDVDDAFPLDANETTDSDNDGIGDNADTDSDNDGVDDADDAFPADACADTDTDNDGMPDDITFGCTTTLTADDDDDGDGFSDDDEYTCGSHRWNAAKTPTDTDGDGLCDNGVDDDDDGDTVLDVDEADGSGIPADCLVTVDCDGDGVDDVDEADGSGLSPAVECAASTDCDGDGTDDGSDAFPVDDSEDTDTDGDGIGDNTDGDADGDGLNNDYDECPLDGSGYTDTDGDGTCDETDDDDDNDGVDDADDCDPYDAGETSDFDGDGICDNADADDDGDGVDDADDECPLDATGSTDTDGDGTCDVSDSDDDNDGVDDSDEEAGCSLSADCDGDGVGDATDAFDNDADADTDTDGDGAADDFGDLDTSSTEWTIATQSNGEMTIIVYDADSGAELCSLTTNAGGLYDSGTDTENASDSCMVTAESINLVADGTAYYTYYGAYFGYWVPNVNVSIGGTSVMTYDAPYQWYYDNFYGNPYDIDTLNPFSSAGTPLDMDDDDDGYSDDDELNNCRTWGPYGWSTYAGSDPLDAADTPPDNDGDYLCDEVDDDDDNDGYSDDDESNNCEGTDPMDGSDYPADNDYDGICDVTDSDDDNDGTDDADDWAPYDWTEDTDTDMDGIGNNADSDDDGDGVDDSDDAEPTDRCSSYDEDGDGLVNDYQDCSTLGFYSTISAGEGANAGDGLSDGASVGLTDSTGLFGGAYEGDQWFQISDTDGVFRIYFDHADGVSSVELAFALSSTDWDSDDYLAAYWVTQDWTYTLDDSRNRLDGDLDWYPYEGSWMMGGWDVPPGAADDICPCYAMAEFSSSGSSESFGLDEVSYLDANGDVIAHTGFEDQAGNLGGYYATPENLASEVTLSNAWGNTVSIDVSDYWQGTVDDDDDNDGYLDDDDAFPLDADEWDDYDGDGIGSNADDDDDGDGVDDDDDAFPRHSQAWDDTDGDGMPDEIGWTDGEIMEDWSSGDFSGMDSTGNGWDRNNGDVMWAIAGDAGASKSGNVADNETSTLEITLDVVGGYYSFDLEVETEERYDVLTFSINGIEVADFSGKGAGTSDHEVWEVDFDCDSAGSYGDSIPGSWVNDGWDDCGDSNDNGVADDEEVTGWWQAFEGSYEGWVDAGSNITFTWTYSKDATVSVGRDRVLVDNILFPYWVAGSGECSDGTDDCNIEDMDDDADGVDDVDDPCPTDAGEQVDTDGDGWCDNADADDDNDGVYDYNDLFPLDENETTDNDGDGIGDNADPDDDNDGCDDDEDDLPNDGSDCTDTDGDGLGDSTDPDDDGDNVDDLNDAFPEDGSAWSDNDGDGIPDFNGDPPFQGDFEGGSIPAGWTTFGDADWFVQSNTVINGVYSAQSGDIADAETSSLELSMDTDAGPYSFSYYTDTEMNWDYLRFYLDGSLVNSWTGPANGGTQSGTLSAGYHTFEWMYYKDFSVSSYTDTVWIDDVSLPISQTWVNNDTDDDNDGVHDDYDLDPFDPCVNVDTDGDGAPDTVATGQFDMSQGADPGNFTVDCDMSSWFEDWDDDGDGWSDDLEEVCDSDGLDEYDHPSDGDGDWICNNMDGDWDNDGYANVDYSCDPVWQGLSCYLDEFNFVDSNDDGEVDADELWFFWAVMEANEYDSDDYEELTYVCGDGSEIPFEWVNDGMVDCEDGSDEQQYDDTTGNKTNWFDCFDGSQVWMDQVNDGVDDCPDGEDEGEMEGDGSDDGYGAPNDEFNDSWAELMEFDSDDNDAMSWDEYWDLLVADGEISPSAQNPGWPGDDDVWDMFPLDPSEAFDFDGDGIGDNSDPDDDNDGVSDGMDEFPYDSTEWNDLDGDGIGDNADDDTDGDGTPDDLDQFDTDPEASADNDGDGADDSSDTDDDNDGVPDVSDWAPYDASEWADTDGDGIGDNADDDDDNDLIPDFEDAFPLDAFETYDNDGDGVGDGSDPDDDNDGIPDGLDAFPMDPTESRDLDGDGIGDNADSDMDEDGVDNAADAFPQNSAEWADTDGDNIGDNADSDQDGDGEANADDPWPLDPTEWDDTDGDGIGDNADTDDDGDGYSDADEAACGTDSKRLSSTPSDFDGDGDCDAIDTSDSRSEAAKGENAQPDLGFTPGFPSVLAAISLLGAAMLGRRKDD